MTVLACDGLPENSEELGCGSGKACAFFRVQNHTQWDKYVL